MSYLVMDVSKYNTVTSWSSVAKNIDGVIIRAGYRGYGSSGTLTTDSSFSSHISGAAAAGIPLSVYFFTQATSTAEAKAEAEYTVNLIQGYTMSMPIFVDSEYANSSHTGRADSLSASNRTTYLVAFCDAIQDLGYTAGIYSSDSWYNSMVNLSKLTSYKLWVARYSSSSPQYVDDYIGWQYTSSGSISGVSGNCDLSHWYEEIGESSGTTEKDPNKCYYDAYTGSSTSLVTALAAVGCLDTSYAYRKIIAAANNVSGYSGTATQNTSMLNLLKQGLLIDPSGDDTTSPTIKTTSNTCGTAKVSITDDVYLSSVTIGGTTQTLASTYTLSTAGTSYKIVATDAAGNSTTKTITVADHSYTQTVVAATCTTDGYTTYKCSACGASYTSDATSATGHTYQLTVTVEPTCSSQGYDLYTCSSCGATYKDNYTDSTGHTLVAGDVVEPTCTEQGYTIYTCSTCGDQVYSDYTEALGHNYTIFGGTIEATCEEEGYDYYECSVCGAKQKTNIVAALGHDYRLVETVEATCDEDGYAYYMCNNCGQTYEDNIVAALGHDYETPVFNWSDDYSTCTATLTCTRCDGTLDMEAKVTSISTTGICEEGGYIIYSATITYNGVRYSSNKEVYQDASGHSYVSTVIAPTCTSQGYTLHTCSVCGEYYRDTYTNALGHDYQLSSTSTASCTTSGYYEYVCTRCGDSYKGDYVEALGHTYNSVIYYPTCTEMGYTVYTCSVCGDTYTGDYTAALGHNFMYLGTSSASSAIDYDFGDCEEDIEIADDFTDYDFNGTASEDDYVNVSNEFTDYDFNDEDETVGDSDKLYVCTRCGIYMTGYDIQDGANLYYGSTVEIVDCPLYPIPESWISEFTKTGTFYVWNPTVSNGRIMITNNLNYVNETELVSGWIDVSEIGKTIVTSSGTKYALGDELVAENLALYETASSTKVSSIKNGYLYITKATTINGRVAVTESEYYVGDTDNIAGWAKLSDL